MPAIESKSRGVLDHPVKPYEIHTSFRILQP
jgi:hypothetical protein